MSTAIEAITGSPSPTLNFDAPITQSAEMNAGLINGVLLRHPELTEHRDALEELVLNERQSRKIYLDANIIDNTFFNWYFATLEKELSPYIWHEKTPGAPKKMAEAWLREQHSHLLREPLELIDQNDDVSIEEKFDIMRSRPWRVFPVGYRLNIADWEDTSKLDTDVDMFIEHFLQGGGNIAVPPKDEAPRKVRFSVLAGDLLSVVRTREVAWINNPGDAVPTSASHAVTLRKRSVFALDVTKVPEVHRYHHLEGEWDKLLATGYEVPKSLSNYANYIALMDVSKEASMSRLADAIALGSKKLLAAIEHHIHLRAASPALIPVSTSYNFRQRSMPAFTMPAFSEPPAEVVFLPKPDESAARH